MKLKRIAVRLPALQRRGFKAPIVSCAGDGLVCYGELVRLAALCGA